MALILQDSGSGLWNVTVDDNGILSTTSVGSGSPTAPTLNDVGMTASWILGVTTSGLLTTTSTTFSSANPTYLKLTSVSTTTTWAIRVLASGIIVTSPAANGFEEDGFGVLVGAVPPTPVSVW